MTQGRLGRVFVIKAARAAESVSGGEMYRDIVRYFDLEGHRHLSCT